MRHPAVRALFCAWVLLEEATDAAVSVLALVARTRTHRRSRSPYRHLERRHRVGDIP